LARGRASTLRTTKAHLAALVRLIGAAAVAVAAVSAAAANGAVQLAPARA